MMQKNRVQKAENRRRLNYCLEFTTKEIDGQKKGNVISISRGWNNNASEE